MYKYFPPERIDVLDKNLICFNNPINFNDPFEFHTTFNLKSFDDHLTSSLASINMLDKLPKEYIEAMNKLDRATRKSIEEKAKHLMPLLYHNQKNSIIEKVKKEFIKFNNKFIAETRVLSLSSDPRNILMWGHYSASHSGFAMELDKRHSFFNQRRNDEDEYGFLREVIYQNEIPCLDPFTSNPVTHFLTKSKAWEYEKEWRMLLPKYSAKDKIIVKDNTFDLFRIPSDAIKTIILGCKASPLLEKDIIAILSQRADYKHINILKAKRSDVRFEVLI